MTTPQLALDREGLRQTWRKVLNVTEVKDSDDFFELGGGSLAMLSIAAELEGKLPVTLEPQEMFARGFQFAAFAESCEAALGKQSGQQTGDR